VEPAGSKRVSLIADYTHSEIRSDISYLVLFRTRPICRCTWTRQHGLAHGRVHAARKGAAVPKISFGGSFVTTAGPAIEVLSTLAKLLIPITPHVHLYAEWQWYELNHHLLYEGFRAHTILSGVRFLM